MTNLMKACDGWERVLRDELVLVMEGDRQPWIKGKIFYSLLLSASNSFVYYIENPTYRQDALVMALALREMAQGFDHDKQDLEKLTISIAQRIIPVGEEAAVVERPDFISEEDWEQAQHDATHTADDKLIRPQLEGFLNGAHYDMPCVWPSEFDDDRVRNAVRAAAHNALKKVEGDYRHCLKEYQKPNSKKWAGIWLNKTYAAKEDMKIIQDFIDRHSLQYDE